MFCAGHARPVKLNGNFEVLLETLENADPGDIVVIDGAGDPARCCMGDLMAAEIKNAGISGVVIWGAHRDTLDLIALELPIFSIGAFPIARPRPPTPTDDGPARVRDVVVTNADFVACDCDGSVFVEKKYVGAAIETARQIQEGELARAKHMKEGRGLREQLAYADYRARRKADPCYTFKDHIMSLADRRK
jgi:regulator of RNase E activity RraA